MKTISSALSLSTSELSQTGIDSARLDSLILLEKVTDKNRAWLLANDGSRLTFAQQQKLKSLLAQRATHKPMAYINSQVEFYGRNFVVNDHVMVPRPETEIMIDIFKDLVYSDKNLLPRHGLLRVADIGTGSGAIGITAYLESKNVHMDLIDVSIDALKVAKTNVDKFTLSINTTKSDLLLNSAKDYTILLCNLPYVPDAHPINKAAEHEPSIALFGGPDGLNVYRKLFDQISNLKLKPLYILIECFPSQHKTLGIIAKKVGYKITVTDNFIIRLELSK